MPHRSAVNPPPTMALAEESLQGLFRATERLLALLEQQQYPPAYLDEDAGHAAAAGLSRSPFFPPTKTPSDHPDWRLARHRLRYIRHLAELLSLRSAELESVLLGLCPALHADANLPQSSRSRSSPSPPAPRHEVHRQQQHPQQPPQLRHRGSGSSMSSSSGGGGAGSRPRAEPLHFFPPTPGGARHFSPRSPPDRQLHKPRSPHVLQGQQLQQPQQRPLASPPPLHCAQLRVLPLPLLLQPSSVVHLRHGSRSSTDSSWGLSPVATAVTPKAIPIGLQQPHEHVPADYSYDFPQQQLHSERRRHHPESEPAPHSAVAASRARSWSLQPNGHSAPRTAQQHPPQHMNGAPDASSRSHNSRNYHMNRRNNRGNAGGDSGGGVDPFSPSSDFAFQFSPPASTRSLPPSRLPAEVLGAAGSPIHGLSRGPGPDDDDGGLQPFVAPNSRMAVVEEEDPELSSRHIQQQHPHRRRFRGRPLQLFAEDPEEEGGRVDGRPHLSLSPSMETGIIASPRYPRDPYYGSGDTSPRFVPSSHPISASPSGWSLAANSAVYTHDDAEVPPIIVPAPSPAPPSEHPQQQQQQQPEDPRSPSRSPSTSVSSGVSGATHHQPHESLIEVLQGRGLPPELLVGHLAELHERGERFDSISEMAGAIERLESLNQQQRQNEEPIRVVVQQPVSAAAAAEMRSSASPAALRTGSLRQPHQQSFGHFGFDDDDDEDDAMAASSLPLTPTAAAAGLGQGIFGGQEPPVPVWRMSSDPSSSHSPPPATFGGFISQEEARQTEEEREEGRTGVSARTLGDNGGSPRRDLAWEDPHSPPGIVLHLDIVNSSNNTSAGNSRAASRSTSSQSLGAAGSVGSGQGVPRLESIEEEELMHRQQRQPHQHQKQKQDFEQGSPPQGQQRSSAIEASAAAEAAAQRCRDMLAQYLAPAGIQESEVDQLLERCGAGGDSELAALGPFLLLHLQEADMRVSCGEHPGFASGTEALEFVVQLETRARPMRREAFQLIQESCRDRDGDLQVSQQTRLLAGLLRQTLELQLHPDRGPKLQAPAAAAGWWTTEVALHALRAARNALQSSHELPVSPKQMRAEVVRQLHALLSFEARDEREAAADRHP